jgi:hypothetical protein
VRFMLIHYVPDAIAERTEPTPEIEAALAAWVAQWTAQGILLHGDRLRPAADATTVQVRGGDPLIADGPFAETKEQVAGYDVIDCADLDEAITVAAGHPTALLGTIELRALSAP